MSDECSDEEHDTFTELPGAEPSQRPQSCSTSSTTSVASSLPKSLLRELVDDDDDDEPAVGDDVASESGWGIALSSMASATSEVAITPPTSTGSSKSSGSKAYKAPAYASSRPLARSVSMDKQTPPENNNHYQCFHNNLHHWAVGKQSRIGMQVARVVEINVNKKILRILDKQFQPRTEVPFQLIQDVMHPTHPKTKVQDAKKVEIQFIEERRSYTLCFVNDQWAALFLRIAKDLISAQNASGAPAVTAHAAVGGRGRKSIIQTSTKSRGSIFASSSASTTVRASMAGSDRGSMSSIDQYSSSAAGSSSPHKQRGHRKRDSVIATSASIQSAQATNNGNDDEDVYLDYCVVKTNKFGKKQDRVFVLNKEKRAMTLLDQKRKFKKEIPVDDVLQIELIEKNDSTSIHGASVNRPSSTSRTSLKDKLKQRMSRSNSELELNNSPDNDRAELQIVFSKTSEQKNAFHLSFVDSFERLHFASRLKMFGKKIIVIECGEETQHPRFLISKKVHGLLRQNVLEINNTDGVLRFFAENGRFEDFSFASVDLEMDPNSKNKVLFTTHSDQASKAKKKHDGHEVLRFAEPSDRAQFYMQWRSIKGQHATTSNEGKWATPSRLTQSSSSSRETRVLKTKDGAVPLHIFIGTWNLGKSEEPTVPLDDWIPTAKYDLYVIGLQEIDQKSDWVQIVQNHINGRMSKYTKLCIQDSSSASEEDLAARDPFFVVKVSKLWSLTLIVMLHKKHKHKLTEIHVDDVATGIAGVAGNKGCIGISFNIEDTSLCFINAHMAARGERLVQRRENYRKMTGNLKLGRKNVDVLHQFHHVFFFGDLNYRVETEFKHAESLVAEGMYSKLLKEDQLLAEKRKGLVFDGFVEDDIDWAPTYRWDRKEATLSNKRDQPPSYTDRVLTYSLPGWGVGNEYDDFVQIAYYSSPTQLGSDHRPVAAVYGLSLFQAHSVVEPEGFDDRASISLRSSLTAAALLPTTTIAFQELQLHLDINEHDTAAQAKLSTPTVLKGLELSIGATFLAKDMTSGAGIVDMAKGHGHCRWREVMEVTPSTSGIELLSRRHLTFTIKQHGTHLTNEVFGFGALGLGTYMGAHAAIPRGPKALGEVWQPFTVPIRLEGQRVANLTGAMRVRQPKNDADDDSDADSDGTTLMERMSLARGMTVPEDADEDGNFVVK